MVYFIRAGVDGPIKIGVSLDPAERLRQLQTTSAAPLRLLAMIPGDYATEAALHAALQEWRLEGEWFSPCAAILGFIEKHDALEPNRDADVSGDFRIPQFPRGSRWWDMDAAMIAHVHADLDARRGRIDVEMAYLECFLNIWGEHPQAKTLKELIDL